MRFAWIGAASGAALLSAALNLSTAAPRQFQQDCSAEAQGARRKEAIGLARRINTAQVHAYTTQKAYQPWEALTAVTVPTGLTVQLATNATGYIFTVKTGCGFGLFSDQSGVIFVGEPLQ